METKEKPNNKDPDQWRRFEWRSRSLCGGCLCGGRSWERPCSPSSVIWHMQRFAALQPLRQWSKQPAPGNKNGNKETNDSVPDPSLMFDPRLITGSPPTGFKPPAPRFSFLARSQATSSPRVNKNRLSPGNTRRFSAAAVHKISSRETVKQHKVVHNQAWSNN